MASEPLPKGLIVDVLTPISQEGGPDLPTYRLILKNLSTVCDMFLIGGPKVGLGDSLSLEERVQLLQIALDSTKRSDLLFFFISSKEISHVLQMVSTINGLPLDQGDRERILLLDSPLLYHSNRGLLELYNGFSCHTSLPFVLLNDPELIRSLHISLKRSHIRTSILKDLIRIPAVKGIISYGPFSRIKNYEKASRLRPEFRVYDGEEMRFLDYPNRSGVVSITSNLKPFLWKQVLDYSLGMRRFVGVETGGEYPLSLIREIKSLSWLLDLKREKLQEICIESIKG